MLSDILRSIISFTQRCAIEFWPIAVAILALILFIRLNLMVLMPLSKGLKEIVDYIETVSKNISRWDKAFNRAPKALYSLWKQFKATTGNSTVNQVGLVFEYFDDRSLWVIAERKKSEAVPLILAVLGVLAAVLHMAYGVWETEGLTATTEVYTKAFALYALEAVALMLSCFIISFLYFVFDRVCYYFVSEKFSAFREKIADSVAGMAERHSIEVKGEQEEVLKHFEEVFSDEFKVISSGMAEIKQAMLKAASDIAGKSASVEQQALEKMTGLFVESLHASAAGYYDKMKEAMSGLTEAQIKASESISTLYSGVDKAVSAQTELNQNTASIIKDLGSFLEQLKKGGEVLATGLSELGQVSGLMNSLPLTLVESIERLEAERKLLSEESRKIIESFGDMESSRVDSMDVAMDSIFNRFSDVTGALMKEYEENSSRTAEKMSDTVDTMLDGMDEKLYTINLYTTNLSEDIKSLTDSLDSSVDNFKTQMKESVDNTFISFDDALSDITQRLGNTVEAMRDSVEELPALIAAAKNDEAGAKENSV